MKFLKIADLLLINHIAPFKIVPLLPRVAIVFAAACSYLHLGCILI